MGVGAADARATLQLENISGVGSASGTVGPGGQELALQSPAGPGSSRDSATLNRPSTSVCLRHRLPAGGRWAGGHAAARRHRPGAPSKASGFFRGPSVWTEDGARGQGPSSGSRAMTHLRHCLRLRSEKSHFNIHPSEKNKTQQNTLFQVLHDSKTVIRSLPGLLFFRTNNPIPAILPSLTFNHL